MFTEKVENRRLIDSTLVQSYIFSTNAPLIITFSPAGSILTSKQVAEGAEAWSYGFFKKNKVNILAFSAIDDRHWFTSKGLKNFIQQLTTQLAIFPERLGYGASMGAYALSNYHNALSLDRMLLITPIPSIAEHNLLSDFNYARDYSGQLTIIVDPFCVQDRIETKQYPKHACILSFAGVGHAVIESLSEIRYLKILIFQFINDDIDEFLFSKAVRQRRNITRYYSYMMRNPTKKNTQKRKSIIRTYQVKWSLNNMNLLVDSFLKKRKKSINKRINAISNKLYR